MFHKENAKIQNWFVVHSLRENKTKQQTELIQHEIEKSFHFSRLIKIFFRSTKCTRSKWIKMCVKKKDQIEWMQKRKERTIWLAIKEKIVNARSTFEYCRCDRTKNQTNQSKNDRCCYMPECESKCAVSHSKRAFISSCCSCQCLWNIRMLSVIRRLNLYFVFLSYKQNIIDYHNLDT